MPILDYLVSYLPRLMWTPEMQDKRARLLRAQATLNEIPPSLNLQRLCDEADQVYIEMVNPKQSWLSFFKEKEVRDNLAKLSSIVSSPRAPITWRMLEYPSFPSNFSTIQSLLSRLAQANSNTSGTGIELSATARQQIYGIVQESYTEISRVINFAIVKMTHSREDVLTWNANRDKMILEDELIDDYLRMFHAREIEKSFQAELNKLKSLQTRYRTFTETHFNLLPTNLQFIYRQEYKKAIGSGDWAINPSHIGASRASPASPASSSSGSGIDAALQRSRIESALHRRVAQLEADRTELRKENAKLTNDNALLKSKVSMAPVENIMQVEELKRELDGLKTSYATEVQSLKDDFVLQIEEVALSGRAAKTAQEKLNKAYQDNESMRLQIEVSKASMSTLERSLEEAHHRLQTQDKAVAEQQRQLEESQRRINLTSLHVSKLETAVKEHELKVLDREKAVQQKEEELSKALQELTEKEVKYLQLSDEVDSLRRGQAQSSADAAYARKLHDEASPGVDPAIAELSTKDKESLIGMVQNLKTDLRASESRVQILLLEIEKRDNIYRNQIEALLRDKSLRQSED
jgi:hypothetical protein